jgi:redox-sensitive bicupin YhaK (pirin superfamily)
MTARLLAPLAVRRDAEIFSIDGGWFRARWHFSFDQYYDPQNMNIGLLRVFNHDTLVPGAVWPMHPHRDIEGITYVLEGEFEHADSMHNGGVLYPGGVQRMTLGSGALHSERNHSKTLPMQFIQMWIIPDTLGLAPSVEQKQYATGDRHNRLLRILRPDGTEGDGVNVHQDASMYVARLDPGAAAEHEIGAGHGGYLYVIEGAVDANGERLATGDAAKITGAGLLRVRAETTTELILVDVPM